MQKFHFFFLLNGFSVWQQSHQMLSGDVVRDGYTLSVVFEKVITTTAGTHRQVLGDKISI